MKVVVAHLLGAPRGCQFHKKWYLGALVGKPTGAIKTDTQVAACCSFSIAMSVETLQQGGSLPWKASMMSISPFLAR